MSVHKFINEQINLRKYRRVCLALCMYVWLFCFTKAWEITISQYHRESQLDFDILCSQLECENRSLLLFIMVFFFQEDQVLWLQLGFPHTDSMQRLLEVHVSHLVSHVHFSRNLKFEVSHILLHIHYLRNLKCLWHRSKQDLNLGINTMNRLHLKFNTY